MVSYNNVSTNETAVSQKESINAIYRKKVWRVFLNIMLGICGTSIIIFSLLIAFPFAKGLIDLRLASFLVMEICLFFLHMVAMAGILSLQGYFKKSNQGLLIRLFSLDIAVWVLIGLMATFISVIAT